MKKTRRSTARRSSSDAVEILDRLLGSDPSDREAADRAVQDVLVGRMIHEARVGAGLTQGELAKLIGSDQAVISRLEDANYRGHTLTMLRRIAEALGKRLEIRFVDAA